MDIAVVGDEKIIRGHIHEMIEKRKPDCHVACFSSGEDLIAAAEPFDMVFLDIQMDGMNGAETETADGASQNGQSRQKNTRDRSCQYQKYGGEISRYNGL